MITIQKIHKIMLKFLCILLVFLHMSVNKYHLSCKEWDYIIQFSISLFSIMYLQLFSEYVHVSYFYHVYYIVAEYLILFI